MALCHTDPIFQVPRFNAWDNLSWNCVSGGQGARPTLNALSMSCTSRSSGGMRVSGCRIGPLRCQRGRNRSGGRDLSPDVDGVGNVSVGGGASPGHAESVSARGAW